MFDFFKKKQQESFNKTSAIVVAAGQSTRMKMNESKQLIEILGKPVIAYTLEALEQTPDIDEIVVVTREQDILIISDIVREYNIQKTTNVIAGGNTRSESVRIGLESVKNADLVVIHDGARPCILPDQLQHTIEVARLSGAAAIGCKMPDTLKMVNEEGIICATLDRSSVWQIQTPQVFKYDLINMAYESSADLNATDDCMLVENIGGRVRIVEGTSSNIKITSKDDIYIAKAILESRLEED